MPSLTAVSSISSTTAERIEFRGYLHATCLLLLTYLYLGRRKSEETLSIFLGRYTKQSIRMSDDQQIHAPRAYSNLLISSRSTLSLIVLQMRSQFLHTCSNALKLMCIAGMPCLRITKEECIVRAQVGSRREVSSVFYAPDWDSMTMGDKKGLGLIISAIA